MIQFVGDLPPVSIESVCVDFRNHSGLGMSCISLNGFDISVACYQFQTGTEVAQTVEHYFRQVVLFNKGFECFCNHALLHGQAVIQGNHQIIVLIGTMKVFLSCGLQFSVMK